MVSSASAAGPPELVRLLAHPLRWALLTALAGSDHRVRELVDRVGEPQNLVSYHLRLLRDGGLVRATRSSHDGRDSYYHLDVRRCAELLAATGEALHPSLREGVALPVTSSRPVAVLFVCTGNGARSQIAEALLRDRAGDRIDVVSAGSHPKPVHPNAIKVLAERGIDISGSRSKPIDQFRELDFDYVITLCDKVREICPEFPGQRRSMHWSIEDPSRASGSLRTTLPRFRALAAELESRIAFLTSLIDNESNKENARHGR